VGESENIAIVRAFVEAFQRDELDSIIDMLDPAVEMNEWPEGPEARTYHGHDGLREALAVWSESWERMDVTVEDVSEVGERVVVTLRQRFKGRGSELEVAMTSTNVFTLRDSKIVRVQLFTDRESALAAVRA
jgi:ketosteroid isomerase-like protein